MKARRCECGKIVRLWWLHRHLPKEPPGRRPSQAGRVLADGRGGFQVQRHGQESPFVIGLRSKAEGYKVLYALANHWDSTTITDVRGRVRTLTLTVVERLKGGENAR